MHEARFVADDTLQKTEMLLKNFVQSIVHSPLLILAAEEVKCIHFNYRS